MAGSALLYIFRWDRKGRKGQRCALINKSRGMNSVHIRFADGYEMVTSGNSIVRAKDAKNSTTVSRRGAKSYPSLTDEEAQALQ